MNLLIFKAIRFKHIVKYPIFPFRTVNCLVPFALSLSLSLFLLFKQAATLQMCDSNLLVSLIRLLSH